MKNKKQVAKNYYKRAEHLLSQVPKRTSKNEYIEESVVLQFHNLVDSASKKLGENYSSYKLDDSLRHSFNYEREDNDYRWKIVPLRTKISEFVGDLESEYDLDKPNFGEEVRKWILSFLGKLTWQIFLWILAIIGAVIGAFFIAKYNLN